MFKGLKPYECYGSPPGAWIPAMPEHWHIAPGFGVLKPVAVKNIGLIESTVLSLSYGHVIVKPLEKLRGLVPESFETYQVLEPGDIVVRPTDLQNDKTSLRVGHVRKRGIITSAYLGLRSAGISDAYAFAYLAALDHMKIFYGMGAGLRQNLDFGDFKRLPVPVPPADEQAAIVKYLGHAHARIDRTIAAKRKLIALLEEQKQAIIHQAVTRGLDPRAPLKDSGISWLGDIPAHWNLRRAKYLFSEFDVRSGTGTERLLSLRARAGLVFHDEVSDKPVDTESLRKYKRIAPGDFVMNRMRAASGVFAVAVDEGLVSPDYSTMRVSDSVDSRFYLRLFKTRAAMLEFKQRSNGLGTGESGFMRLYSEDFGRITLPMPPRHEQVAIADYLVAEEHETEALTSKITREIELLREFRTRLTSDVVTGQVDVRAIAATLPELSDDTLPDTDDELDELIDGDLELVSADE